MANVTVEQTEAALKKFSEPDKYSRTTDHEGRRVAPVKGGWLLLNYLHYREKLSQEELRAKATLRQQRRRDRLRDNSGVDVTPCHATVTPCHEESRLSRQAEAEAEAEGRNTPLPPSFLNSTAAAQFVCQELGLAGTEIRWLIRDAIDAKSKDGARSVREISEAMISAWRRYDTEHPVGTQYRKSVKTFFSEPTWEGIVAPKKVYVEKETGEEIA